MRRFFRFVCLLLASLVIQGCGSGDPASSGASSSSGADGGGRKIKIAMLPKLINIDYFDACERGARQAAGELGVELIYNGPTTASGSEQTKFFDTWIRQRVDAICVARNQPKSIAKFIRKAQAAGIKVLTWDTDAPESGRDLMVNQVDDRVLGEMLIDDLARQMEEKGKWAVIIGSLDAVNLNTWRRHGRVRQHARCGDSSLRLCGEPDCP